MINKNRVFLGPETGALLRAFALAATALLAATPVLAAGRHHSHRPAPENAFGCAVHVAVGEAPWGDVREAAVIVNGLVQSARANGRSICAEAHVRYAPRYSSPDWAVRAATNVLSEGASLVPPRFRGATEFRAPGYRGRPGRHFRRVGQLSRGGNVFYEPS